MPLIQGTKLGSYEIVSPLGAGGMGEVYCALDTKLGREVAIKVLPEAFARDEERLSRFEREARILASLNHPNVASIYNLEQEEGQTFLVLELVPGSSLDELITRESIAVKEALSICSQVAAALEAAHEKGIVHRDLKPANIKITPKNVVKVLDFGIAKIINPNFFSDNLSIVKTIGLDETGQGMVLGTVTYMSPEQARGKQLDKQTDIWSFGCVLFEILSRRKAFDGETVSDVLVAILDREPNWENLPSALPSKIHDLIIRCLQKDVRQRLHDIGDARIELEEILASPGLTTTRKRKRTKTAVIRKNVDTDSKQIVFRQPVLTQLTSAGGIHEFPAWSPDGKRLAYSLEVKGFKKIFIQEIDGGKSWQVTTGSYDDIQPAWATAADSILFVRSNQGRGKLQPGDVFGQYTDGDIWRIDLQSGKEQKIISNGFNPSFSPDGKLIALDASWAGPRRIWVVNNHGSNPQQITGDVSEAVSHVNPSWSPDGEKIVFQNIERTKFDIKVVELVSRKVEWVTNDLFQDLNPVWSGDYIYFSSYRSGGLNIWRVPANSPGSPQQLTIGAGQDVEIAISPDGKQLAFTILRQNADVWKLPVSPATGEPINAALSVIVSTREDSRGAWSPEGNQIAFNSDRTGDMNIWKYSFADEKIEQLTKGPGGDYQPNWSPDGNWITFFSCRAGNADIWLIDSAGNHLKRLTKTKSLQINPFFSPDGKQIAYQSDESGRLEVWLMNHDGSDQRQLSDIGVMGHFLRWSNDGKFIFFRCSSMKQSVMKISIDGGEPIQIAEVAGGSHISFSPDQSMIMDVIGHKQLWVSPLSDGKPKMIFEFDNSDARIDYPMWSPDGNWILFDKFQPQGGDIWIMKNFS